MASIPPLPPEAADCNEYMMKAAARRLQKTMDELDARIDFEVAAWVERSLNKAPSYLKYYRSLDDIVVFLPRYIRVRICNHMARVSGQKPNFTDEGLTHEITFAGWKIVDGYENALVMAAIKYAGMDEKYTYTVPFQL